MKDYKVKVTLTFRGDVTVRTKNKEQAKEFVQKHFSALLGNTYTVAESNAKDEEGISDWEFPIHPDKKINSVKLD